MLIYGELNEHPLNSIPVNGAAFFSSVLGGHILQLNQNVLLQIAVAGIICTINQDTRAIVENIEIPINQNVLFKSTSFLTLYGFDLQIIINGNLISKSSINSALKIVKESNQNTICEFSIKFTTNPIALIDSIDGKSIKIIYYDNTRSYRQFTGVIDTPQLDIINESIKITASNRREELIRSKLSSNLATIGRYSRAVQGEITSIAQELEYRLQTTPKDVDFDSANNLNINSWYAKDTADYVFNNDDIYYREPSLTYQNRSQVVNDINIYLKYQYTRLYHYQRNFTWAMDTYQKNLAATYTIDSSPVSFCTVGMIDQAIENAGWREDNTLTYVDQYPATIGARFGFLGPVWNPLNDTVTFNYTGGGLLGGFYSVQHPTRENTRILSAAWTASTRFSQYIEEDYTINVKSTQSKNRYGTVNQFINVSLEDEFEANEWENYKILTAPPSNAVSIGDSYYANQDTGTSALNNAILTAIDKAKLMILSTHRDTKIDFEIPFSPAMELKHTVEIDTDVLSCKGKITRIEHFIDLIEKKGHSTKVELSLFRSTGSASTTATRVPTRPSDSVNIPSGTITLGNHFGQDYDSTAGSSSWTGYVGNTTPQPPTFNQFKFNVNDPNTYPKFPKKTAFKELFIVTTPSIPNALRKVRKLTKTASYEQAIPNDNLSI